MNKELIEKIIRKQGIYFNGITESKYSHIDGNDLVFRSDVHKVFAQILPEIINLCADEAIDITHESFKLSESAMRNKYNATKAIEKEMKGDL